MSFVKVIFFYTVEMCTLFLGSWGRERAFPASALSYNTVNWRMAGESMSDPSMLSLIVRGSSSGEPWWRDVTFHAGMHLLSVPCHHGDASHNVTQGREVISCGRLVVWSLVETVVKDWQNLSSKKNPCTLFLLGLMLGLLCKTLEESCKVREVRT